MDIEKLNILLISPIPPPAGGIASWTTMYLEWMKSKNVEIFLVNNAISGNRIKKNNSKLNLIDELNRSWNIFSQILGILGDQKIDLVHLNTTCSRFGIIRDYFCVRILDIKGILCLVQYHCNIENQIRSGMQNFFLKKLSNTAIMNLVLNEPSRNYLEKKTNNETRIIPNFIEEGWILPNDKYINPEILKVIFIGQLIEEKGISEIITVANKFPNIKFDLVGRYSQTLLKLIPKNVSLYGELSANEVKRCLNAADVFLFPTHSEGFSLSLLEAMGMGLPIITTTVGANLEMMDFSGGIFVDIGSTLDIENALRTMENPILRQKASRVNIERVKNRYIIDIVMTEVLKTYYIIRNMR